MMKHRLLALLCTLLLLFSAIPASYALEGDALRAADTLATLHLIRGNQFGDYALDAPATRAHAAVLLTRLSGGAGSPASAAPRDLPAWAAAEIQHALHMGWFPLPAGADFCPDQAITSQAWCSALLRLLGYSAQDFQEEDAPAFAQRIGLLFRPCPATITRGILFETALEALVFPGKSGTPLIQQLIDGGKVSRSTASALGLLEQPLTARQIADRHTAAVFALHCFLNQAELEADMPSAAASGFFITSDGLAVTNCHSIKGASHAVATLSTGESYPVEEVVWYNRLSDLALIRISRTSVEKKETSAFAWLEISDSASVRPGDPVFAISNPLGQGLAVSQGVVGAVNRKVSGQYLPCIVNTADISQGSSGGALLNEYGHVIGVTTGSYAKGNGLYLALPADLISTLDWTAAGLPLQQVWPANSTRQD